MAALRPSSLAVVTTHADDDDGHLTTAQCTPKQEAFALAWAHTGNKAAAYRMAYNVHERTLPNVIWVSASRVAALPQVQARYRVLVQQAALETIMSIRELLQMQVDIATADPAEVVKVVARNCRHCRGVNYGYQWKDEIEYSDACIVALANEDDATPSELGGYGFNGALEPVKECPHCYGVGIEQTVITPSDQLNGKARKLYAGAKQDRFGCIEVKLHDQQKAAEMVARMLGAFNDKLDLRTPEERAKAEQAGKLPENITAENAAKAYLQLLN